MKELKILMLSNQQYDFPLKTNKWHIATLLARHGYKVVFIDPPLRFKALKNIFRLSKAFVDRKDGNLVVYKPINLFTFWPFSLFNTYIHSQVIKQLLGHDEKYTVLWIYHFDFPDLENFIKYIPFDIMIYDCVDEYTAFPEYAAKAKVNPTLIKAIQSFDETFRIKLNQNGLSGVDWVNYRENWLAKHSDIIFVSAPGLYDKFHNKKKKTYFLPNACDYEKFDIEKSKVSEPADIKKIKHPRVGFSGAIDSYKNNISLIEKSADTYHNYSFILIGPEKVSDPNLDLSKLRHKKNVHFLGLKKWEETPKYFAYFDAYFIPYNLNDYTIKGCFPVKYFESLAAGLPTIVTNLPAYRGFDPDGYISRSGETFIENIKLAIDENSPTRIKKRKALAKENSWEKKMFKQLKYIEEKLK